MKIGVDFHGVLDTPPPHDQDFWKKFTKAIVDSGNELHIITGTELTNNFLQLLKEMDISYTNIFSVSSFLIENGVKVEWRDNDNPYFNDLDWNKAKGEYCEKEKISLHFDDSDLYGEFFKSTIYSKIPERKK